MAGGGRVPVQYASSPHAGVPSSANRHLPILKINARCIVEVGRAYFPLRLDQRIYPVPNFS